MEPTSTGVARNGDAEIYYEVFGDGSELAETLLLVNGLGSQLLSYSPEFCRRFVDAGFRTIRFDNREVGLSSKTEGRPPNMKKVIEATRAREPAGVPYGLPDMANDAVAVLDACGVAAAHVWGMSMGGMIVQQTAVDHPDRVRTLTSVMSTTGNPKVGGATPEAMAVLTTAPPADREGAIEHGINSRAVNGGSLYDPEWSRELGEAAYDRCFHPIGTAFQMAAITSAGNRTSSLGAITAPTTVIHGRLDPLIQLSGGEATADAIADSKLVIYDEMGHDIPEPLWDSYVAELVELAGRAR